MQIAKHKYFYKYDASIDQVAQAIIPPVTRSKYGSEVLGIRHTLHPPRRCDNALGVMQGRISTFEEGESWMN